MTVYTTRQYRAITTAGSKPDDPVSVHTINHLADSINNYNAYAGRMPLIAMPCIPYWQSWDNSTVENVVAVFAARIVPDGYNNLVWTAGHVLADSATGTTTWRLYCDERAYYGDAIFDATYTSIFSDRRNFITSSKTHAINVDEDLNIIRSTMGKSYLILTAQNDDNTTVGYLTSLNVWPKV